MNEPESLSTAEVATMGRVTPSSVKRWADEGLLPCEKTAGGHRRFRRVDVERLLAAQRLRGDESLRQAELWMDSLLRGDNYGLLGALYLARSRHGAWYRVADELGGALRHLGELWAKGKVTVAEEHAATERLHRGLAQVAQSIANPEAAPNAILVALEDEEHTLGLSLAELCLKEAGWTTLWVGRRTPTTEIVRLLPKTPVHMVAASASTYAPEGRLRRAAREVGQACVARGVPFVMGGSGPWPESVAGGIRLQTYGELNALLVSTGERRRS